MEDYINNSNNKDSDENLEIIIKWVQTIEALKSMYKYIDSIDIDWLVIHTNSAINVGIKDGGYTNEIDRLRRILDCLPHLVKSKNIFFGADNKTKIK